MGVGASSFVNRALEVPCLSAIHMTLVFGQVALSISCLATRSCALCAQPVVPGEQLLVFAELRHPVPSMPPQKSHTGTVPISADTSTSHQECALCATAPLAIPAAALAITAAALEQPEGVTR